MSFKSNDTNNTINLGNYEEFFILYMDNELTAEQKAMVDAFLAAHPDLQSEFELIQSLQLQPEESISFDKEGLLADQMKVNLAEEDLLLFIDGELPAERAKELELEISNNTSLAVQHNLLMQTKLDASEKIVYPNKAELYKKEERTVRFGVWMRVAAAIVVIATVGVFYFNTNNNSNITPGVNGEGSVAKQSDTKQPLKESTKGLNDVDDNTEKQKNDVIVPVKDQQQDALLANKQKDKVKDQQVAPVQDVVSDDNKMVAQNITRDRSNTIDANPTLTTTSVTAIPKDFINTGTVTSNILPRTTIQEATTPIFAVDNGKVAASNKGSLKGLLRKATRVIEKRTGIEAANEDGEVLIGALAVKLK
jgi:hypothetical protein